MRTGVLYLIITIAATSCNQCDYINDNLTEAYISESLTGFHNKIAARGMSPKDLKLDHDLIKELSEIKSGTSDNEIDLFIKKLKILKKCEFWLDTSLVMFDNLTPYLVNITKDSTVLLFNVEKEAIQDIVYLRVLNSDTARQVSPLSSNPIIININTLDWNDSNPPVKIRQGSAGYFITKSNGKDHWFEIKNRINCY